MKVFILLTMLFTAVLAESSEAAENFVLRRGLLMSLEDQVADEGGLKVMWWNVGCSSDQHLGKLSEKDRASVDPENQWKNIRELIASDRLRPDVLIFGEYCPSAFDDPTYREIRKYYKHKYRLDKINPDFNIRNGFRVFSRLKIKNLKESVLHAESFVDTELMQLCGNDVKNRNPKSFGIATYWNRPKISFTVDHKDKTYQISPVHLANPWSFVKSCIGILHTPRFINRDTTNANYVQAQQVAESFSDEENMIVIGDFNAPKSLLGDPSNSYRLLENAFGPSVIESDQYTYDDPRRNFPSTSIDHAFVSADLLVKEAVVLPFAGSDHLPIYIVVE